jgi:lantibiotic modifying enzyme
LIVRDTKTYGALQQDETHPDLLRDQIDREWLWDNLWAELKTRPHLSLFIGSELAQARAGDIPYFSGCIDSHIVSGGDGTTIDLSTILDSTPLESAKARISEINEDTVIRQQRLAATLLGITRVPKVTSPELESKRSYLENALVVADFITSRVEAMNGCSWIYTTYNAAPKASTSAAINIRPCDPYLYDGVSGIALFLHAAWTLSGRDYFRDSSIDLIDSVFMEIDSDKNQTASGFTGLSSVVYAANRMASTDPTFLFHFENKIHSIAERVAELASTDPNVDFLLGIAGTSCAMLPYVSRTSSSTGSQFLFNALLRLLDEGSTLLRADAPIPGMLNLRGLSHGISGVALALYRLGLYLNKREAVQLAELLLIREFELIESGGWTDSHKYAGEALVGWCHGSAGITLALSEMSELFTSNSSLQKYREIAYKNTVSRGRYSSLCLCHGVLGNIFCLSQPNAEHLPEWGNNIDADLLDNGFQSLDQAQSLGVGLMTGVTGAGFYLLAKASGTTDRGFLTLT